MEDNVKKEMSWKELLIKVSTQLKEASIKFFVCLMCVAITVAICSTVIVFVYLLVAHKSSYEHDESRLATQMEVILEDDSEGMGTSLSASERVDLINKLIVAYKPETDSLKPSFNPSEDKLPTVQEIVAMLKNGVSDDKKKTLDGVKFPKKEDGKFGSGF